jgi:DUF1009 family protein
MAKTEACALALEAGKCIIIDRDNFIQKANRAGIVVIGLNSKGHLKK